MPRALTVSILFGSLCWSCLFIPADVSVAMALQYLAPPTSWTESIQDPNSWKTVEDVMTAFQSKGLSISKGAADNLLKAKGQLPGGRFESVAQIETLIRTGKVRGLGINLWLGIKPHLKIVEERLQPRWVVIYTPHTQRANFEAIRHQMDILLEQLGGEKERFIFFLEGGAPPLLEYTEALVTDDFLENQTLRRDTEQRVQRYVTSWETAEE